MTSAPPADASFFGARAYQLFETLGLLARLPPAIATPLIPQLASGLHDLIKGNHAKFVNDPEQWRTLLHLLALSIDASVSARYACEPPRLPPRGRSLELTTVWTREGATDWCLPPSTTWCMRTCRSA